ncbi:MULTISPECIES: hypothetical protein [Enterobacterales]|uniref:hypothetical protein n=1 Tax=Enterobacterales TaxID=91347 RepID=UPI002EDAB660
MIVSFKKINLLLPVTLILSACSTKAEFTPGGDELTEAIVGVPYLGKIEILGGRVIYLRKDGKVNGSLTPENSGLRLEYCDIPAWRLSETSGGLKDANCVLLKGTPVKAGRIKINLHGKFYGNMLFGSDSFSKDFVVQVADH